MSKQISRPANDFDDRVDEAITRALDGEPPEDSYGEPAAAINRVFMEVTPRLSPTAKARHLAQLEARMQKQAQVRKDRSVRPFGTMLRWVQVAAVAIVVVLLANGISSVSASSLPGSPLYAVKRLTEQGNFLFAPTSGERARVWMNLASVRLAEAQQLAANHSRVEPELLDAIEESLLRALLETAGTSGPDRVALLEQITQLAIQQQTVLDELASQATPPDRARLQETARLLQGVATVANAGQTDPALVTPAVPANLAPTTPATPTTTPTPTQTQTPDPTARPTSMVSAENGESESATPTPTTGNGPAMAPTGTLQAGGERPERQPTATVQSSREHQSDGSDSATSQPDRAPTQTRESNGSDGNNTPEHD